MVFTQNWGLTLPKSRLVSGELLPTEKKDRHISPFEFMLMWIGMSILLAVFPVPPIP